LLFVGAEWDEATGLSRCFGPNELGLNSEGRNIVYDTRT
jgi:hypothetical protein